jgi:hypothetical protein
MVTSTIKSNELELNNDFPKLMVNKGNFIGDGKGKMVVILALSEDDDENWNKKDNNTVVGVIVYSDDVSIWPLGYISYAWTGFEDYHGEITLKNK